MNACLLRFPEPGQTLRVVLPRVPVAGDVVDFDEDCQPWLAGRSFTVKRVIFPMSEGCEQNPNPPHVLLRDP